MSMEDLNDIFKEPEETVTLTIDHIPRDSDLQISTGVDDLLSNGEVVQKMNELIITDRNERYIKELVNRWHKLKETIEIERAAIRASDDDGLIRVGRFRTLNKVCEIINELEGKNG